MSTAFSEKTISRIIRFCILNDRISISELANGTELSIPTTTKYVNLLIERGLMVRYGKKTDSQGRQPYLFGINKDSALFAGVDIKNSMVHLALMDLGGNIVKAEEKHIRFENSPEMMERICSMTEKFISRELPRVKAICVNISGRVDSEAGYSYSIFNFEGTDEPLSEILTERFGVRTYIDNDTRAMTWSELIQGTGRGYGTFLFLNAGWGIGLGIVINGELFYGANGYSGEIGHTNVFNNEIMCHCGKKGCLETEASGRAMVCKLRKRVSEGKSTILSGKLENGESVDERDIVEAANHEDTLSIELLENAGNEIGRQVANLVNIFNPEAVIIGGSLVGAGDYFVQPIAQSLRKYALKLMVKNVSLLTSKTGDRAGVSGACLLARKKFAGI